MKLGFLQLRPEFGRVRENVAAATRLLGQARDATVVLPELFNTGYLFLSREELKDLAEAVPSGPTTSELVKAALDRGLNLIFGLAESDGGRFFNTAVLVTAQGQVHRYRKTHLFDREKLFFEPGSELSTPVAVPEARLGLMVCFDWMFPEVTRILALEGAQVICHPSNLVLPWCQTAMHTRCLENRVLAVTANRVGTEARGDLSLTFTGGSQIVGPKGQMLARADPYHEELRIVDVDVTEADDKHATPRNDLFGDRRPELYAPLSATPK
jgi:predicted amidohydrolase